MPSVTARSLGVIMWCLPLVLQPSTTLASEPQAKASSEQQTKNPNAPPALCIEGRDSAERGFLRPGKFDR